METLAKENFFTQLDLIGPLFQGEFVWSPLVELNEYFQKRTYEIKVKIPQGVFIGSHVSIDEGTIIEPGAYIQGPCIIGKNCKIRHGAYIRENVLIGDDCVVGHATEVKHSIMLKGSKAAHFAYVGDSILGHRVNLGAGVKIANFRLDEKEIEILINGKKILTGLKKMGAILGDDVQIGCNAVLNPGTLMEKKSRCYPCVNIGGIISENKLARPPWRKHVK